MQMLIFSRRGKKHTEIRAEETEQTHVHYVIHTHTASFLCQLYDRHSKLFYVYSLLIFRQFFFFLFFGGFLESEFLFCSLVPATKQNRIQFYQIYSQMKMKEMFKENFFFYVQLKQFLIYTVFPPVISSFRIVYICFGKLNIQ